MSTKRILILTTLISTSVLANTVNFYATISNREETKRTACIYEDVLVEREAKDPVDPPISTITFSKQKISNPENAKFCFKTLSNLTNLDQQKVRDDIGKILLEMPCAPDSSTDVMMYGTDRPKIKDSHPNVKHTRIINKIGIDGCLEEMPPVCSMPAAFSTWNPDSVLIEYEQMMKTFNRCKDAVIKKVDDENLLEQWQSNNDPNSKGKNADTKHKNEKK